MSRLRGDLPNMSNQLREPGPNGLGVPSFCAPLFPPFEPLLRLIRPRTISGSGVGGGANLKQTVY